MSRKKTPFGHGTVKYRTDDDFPDLLNHDGGVWVRRYRCKFLKTGMTLFEYESGAREEDLRVYLDAAGHIWDEKTDGIL
jgi:hypothetical protein